MNIKKLIKSQRIRHLIMKCGAWLPDRIMLSMQYRILLHRWPDLKNPKRFTEWIQYYKMHYRNADMLRCVDKYEVRSYVEEKGLGKYLNELYQVCDRAEEIDFEKLPQKFVIKTTNGGSGDNVLVVTDKNSLDIESTVIKVNSWLKKNYSNTSREWAYSGASCHPRIIVEKYLENNNASLDDFKFYCFDGKYRFLSIDKDRYGNHTRAYFDADGNFREEVTGNYNRVTETPDLPDNIADMIEVAERFAKDFPFVRVDLYNVNNHTIFGELTFYPASGYSPYNPDSFDFELGKYFKDCMISKIGGGKFLISRNLSSNKELLDYKFFCFDGNPIVCQMISGRYTDEHIDFFDLEWKRLDGIVGMNPNATNSSSPIMQPRNLEKMVEISRILSADFPFVRVDLYNVDGKIYFGELTFYPSSGYGFFTPDSFDFELGKYFNHLKV